MFKMFCAAPIYWMAGSAPRMLMDVEALKSRFRGFRNPHVKAVVLFGSRARGEACERSDVDLLLLHDGCMVEDPVERRRMLYLQVMDLVGDLFESVTVVDMELREFLSPKEVTPLLLNIYWDAVVVYDQTGSLGSFLEKVRDRIVRSGLRRVRDGRAYYWVLPEPPKEVRIV